MRRKKNRPVTTPAANTVAAESSVIVGETHQMDAEASITIGTANQATVSLDTSVSKDVRHDAITKPAMDVSAIMAAQDHFEAKKTGEANHSPVHVEGTLRALNQALPELDWEDLKSKILSSVGNANNIRFENPKIIVIGATANDAKNLSARVWKALGELRKAQQIRSLPTVELSVENRP